MVFQAAMMACEYVPYNNKFTLPTKLAAVLLLISLLYMFVCLRIHVLIS